MNVPCRLLLQRVGQATVRREPVSLRRCIRDMNSPRRTCTRRSSQLVHLLMVAGDRHGRDGLRRLGPFPSPQSPPAPQPTPGRDKKFPVAVPHHLGSALQGRGQSPVRTPASRSTRLPLGPDLVDDFDDESTMGPRAGPPGVAGEPGSESDGVWSPEGRSVAPGLPTGDQPGRRDLRGRWRMDRSPELTNKPAIDWGPDWSPDGDDRVQLRPGRRSAAWLSRDATKLNVRPDRDGSMVRISVFLARRHASRVHGARGIRLRHLRGRAPDRRKPQADRYPGSDGWPVWSPDGSSMAFATERDDCPRTEPGRGLLAKRRAR